MPFMTEEAQRKDEAIPPEVEVKLEVEDMTEEESALFGGTSNLTFHQVQELDAMRSCALADQARMKGKGKTDFLHDPNLPACTVKIKNIC